MSADDLEGDDIWGDGGADSGTAAAAGAGGDAPAAMDATAATPSVAAPAAAEPEEEEETRHMAVGELRQRIHLIQNDIRIMKSDVQRITHESRGQRDRIRENQEKVKLNKQLPYLVANVVEILEPDAEDGTYCLHLLKRNQKNL
jgi:ATP-dependent 26S proteasome regulatory subunit